jgi:hypothetical protein
LRVDRPAMHDGCVGRFGVRRHDDRRPLRSRPDRSHCAVNLQQPGLYVGLLHGLVRARSDPVQRLAAPSVRHERSMAEYRHDVPLRMRARKVHRDMYAGQHAVRWPTAADVRYERRLAKHRLSLRRRLHEWNLSECVHAWRDAMRRRGPPDLQLGRRLGQSDGVHVHVRERRVHGRLLARRNAVLQRRRGDMRFERPVGQPGGVRRLDACLPKWRLRCLHASSHPVHRQRGRDVRGERRVEQPRAVHQPGMPEWLVHGRLHAGYDPVRRQRRRDVRRQRPVGRRAGVCQPGLRGGCVRRPMRAGSHAMQRAAAADLR